MAMVQQKFATVVRVEVALTIMRPQDPGAPTLPLHGRCYAAADRGARSMTPLSPPWSRPASTHARAEHPAGGAEVRVR